MANKNADEGTGRPKNDPLRRAAEQGPVRGKDASQRAAEMAADEDAPQQPDTDATAGDETVPGVPPVMPGGAALTGDTAGTAAAPGGGYQAAGAPLAAGFLAEAPFGQNDVKVGLGVFTADDVRIGTVAEVGPERILVDRSDHEGQTYIPYTAVASVEDDRIRLSVPRGGLGQQDWEQVVPGARPASSQVPNPGTESRASSAHLKSDTASVEPTPFAAGNAAVPENSEHAGPVTTGRGVQKGPTEQTIRLGPSSTRGSADEGRATRPRDTSHQQKPKHQHDK